MKVSKSTGVGSLFPGDLPDTGIEPVSPALQADSLPAELPGKPPKTYIYIYSLYIYIPYYYMTYVNIIYSYIGIYFTYFTLSAKRK